MTKISTIHGIGADEFAGRGAMVQPTGYVPYLSLTKGEMRLWLAAQRAKVLAQWYGSDGRQYSEAYQMIENALNRDLRQGVNYVGAVPDYLQQVAYLIKRASSQNAPASIGGFMARRGPYIGDIIIPYEDRLKACMDAASKIKHAPLRIIAQAKCVRLAKKEKIINGHLANMSPHMLYKDLPKVDLTADVLGHRMQHRFGVEGIAGVGGIKDYPLVYEWIENGVLQKNTQGGVGLMGSIESSYYLAPDADARLAKFRASGGASQTKWGVQGPRIGIAPLVLAAIVTIVGGAISAAFGFLTEIRKTELLAMSESKGFGTPEFSANKDQWLGETTGGLDTTTLIFLAAGAALLLSGEN